MPLLEVVIPQATKQTEMIGGVMERGREGGRVGQDKERGRESGAI